MRHDGVAVSQASPYVDQRSGHAVTGQQLVDGPYFDLWLVSDISEILRLPNCDRYWVVPLSGEVEISNEKAAVGDCLIVNNRFQSVNIQVFEFYKNGSENFF